MSKQRRLLGGGRRTCCTDKAAKDSARDAMALAGRLLFTLPALLPMRLPEQLPGRLPCPVLGLLSSVCCSSHLCCCVGTGSGGMSVSESKEMVDHLGRNQLDNVIVVPAFRGAQISVKLRVMLEVCFWPDPARMRENEHLPAAAPAKPLPRAKKLRQPCMHCMSTACSPRSHPQPS